MKWNSRADSGHRTCRAALPSRSGLRTHSPCRSGPSAAGVARRPARLEGGWLLFPWRAASDAPPASLQMARFAAVSLLLLGFVPQLDLQRRIGFGLAPVDVRAAAFPVNCGRMRP